MAIRQAGSWIGAVFFAVSMSALVACSGDGTPSTEEDAGGEPLTCSQQSDCPGGSLCSGGLCKEATCASNADCGSGSTCDLLTGVCKPDSTSTDGGTPTTDGGTPATDGGTVTTDGGSGAACTTKYDCPSGQICKNRICKAPATNNSCASDNDCPRSRICNFSRQCEDGCIDAKDCDSPKLCHPQKYVCEVCSLTNPCAAGKSCVGGSCETAVACTGPAATQCAAAKDGTVCVNSFCQNCTSHADCKVDPYYEAGTPTLTNPTPPPKKYRVCASDGLCKAVTCTDANCQGPNGLNSPKAYCDTATSQCKDRECISNSDCATSAAGTLCDQATNTCTSQPNGCDVNACNTDCAARPPDPATGQAPTCNTATCTCDGSGGSGGDGAACVTEADCQQGFACGLGICTAMAVDSSGNACDAITCALGGLLGDPCVSGADSAIECDPIGCLFSAISGGSGSAPCL